MATSTITLRVTAEEKAFFSKMAEFNALSVSELIREKALEALEDQSDFQKYQAAMSSHQKKDESLSLKEMRAELGL
ncbi:MAG: DUF6290 family protein [Streptococcaceae bacterium]|jgi:uncharacterized protein (DUF1778 family)|nr:DUF6290 family protein [Streptococcaceae bacterium]